MPHWKILSIILRHTLQLLCLGAWFRQTARRGGPSSVHLCHYWLFPQNHGPIHFAGETGNVSICQVKLQFPCQNASLSKQQSLKSFLFIVIWNRISLAKWGIGRVKTKACRDRVLVSKQMYQWLQLKFILNRTWLTGKDMLEFQISDKILFSCIVNKPRPVLQEINTVMGWLHCMTTLFKNFDDATFMSQLKKNKGRVNSCLHQGEVWPGVQGNPQRDRTSVRREVLQRATRQGEGGCSQRDRVDELSPPPQTGSVSGRLRSQAWDGHGHGAVSIKTKSWHGLNV